MNWVDGIIIVVALLSAYIGYKQGLIRTLFTLAGLLVGVVIAGHLSDNLAEIVSSKADKWAYILSFVFIVLVVTVAASLLGAVARGLIKIMMMGWLDNIGGIVLGLLVGALVVAAGMTAALQWESAAGQTLGGAIADSSLATFLIDKFRLLLGLLPGQFDVVTRYFHQPETPQTLGKV